jgi:hypothetical protein
MVNHTVATCDIANTPGVPRIAHANVCVNTVTVAGTVSGAQRRVARNFRPARVTVTGSERDAVTVARATGDRRTRFNAAITA